MALMADFSDQRASEELRDGGNNSSEFYSSIVATLNQPLLPKHKPTSSSLRSLFQKRLLDFLALHQTQMFLLVNETQML